MNKTIAQVIAALTLLASPAVFADSSIAEKASSKVNFNHLIDEAVNESEAVHGQLDQLSDNYPNLGRGPASVMKRDLADYPATDAMTVKLARRNP